MKKRFVQQSIPVSRILFGLLGTLLLIIPLAACATPDTPDNPLQSVPLNLNIPANALNAPVTGPVPDSKVLHVRITLKVDPKWLEQMQKQKIEPGKPSRLEELAKKVGISDENYRKIKDFFSTEGIAIKLNKLRTHLALDAKASTLSKVLHTKFVYHKYNERTFYAPDKANPAKVPQFLFNSIDAITGLDNYSAAPVAQSALHIDTLAFKNKASADCSPAEQSLRPKLVAHTYGTDQLWQRGWHGENMTVNLVEIDGSYRQDIDNYLQCIDFKGSIDFKNIGNRPTEAAGESTLDIQMVAGLARSVHINVYQTGLTEDDNPWVRVNDMLQAIIDDNVNNANAGSTVSISLGTSEEDMLPQDIRAIERSIEQLTRVEHMTVFVASGDCGAFNTRQYGQLAVSYPASSPWAVAVGGTMLQVDQQGNRVNEMVWQDGSNRRKCSNQWGSGGGVSALFQRADWQKAPGIDNQYSNGKRQLPDVSAVAYGLAVYFKGEWGAVGGTSAAAPIWAASMALLNQGLIKERGTFLSDTSPRVFYETFNANRRAYFDVTRGDNLYYKAGSGWDYATGLGAPYLPEFYRVLSAKAQG